VNDLIFLGAVSIPFAIGMLMPGWRSLLVWAILAGAVVLCLLWLLLTEVEDKAGAVLLLLANLYVIGLLGGLVVRGIMLAVARARRRGLLD
jgi:hypothetical protein